MRRDMKRAARNARVAGLAVGLVAFAAGAVYSQAQKTASFNVTAVHTGTGVQLTINSRVWVTPTQARADVKHPLEGDVRYLVRDGSFLQLDPQTKKGMKAPLPEDVRKSRDNFDLLVGRFAFDAEGVIKNGKKVKTETVSGFACDVLTSSVTEGDARRTITVWMPQKMNPKFPVKAVMEDRVTKPGASVSQKVTVTLSNVRLNQPIAASVFAVPAGYKIETGPAAPPGGGG
jgi:outer membrane lipoprotein-sorting protein